MMIISKKKYEEALALKEKEICDRFMRERDEREQHRYVDNELCDIRRQLYQLRDEVNELRGIKEKYDAVCACVTKQG